MDTPKTDTKELAERFKQHSGKEEITFPEIQQTNGEKEPQEKLSVAKKLKKITEGFHFFKDDSGAGWAKVNGECLRTGDSDYKYELLSLYEEKHNGETPHSKAVQRVLDSSRAKAVRRGDIEAVYIRNAKQGEQIFIDRSEGYISITGDDWKSVTSPNVNFFKPRGSKVLPTPKTGKDGIALLREYLNYETEEDFQLMVGWLLATFNVGRPCPILILQGEQGSAKSTNTRILRSLVDPTDSMISALPKDEETINLHASNTRVVAFDNLSGVSSDVSDALARLCTGTSTIRRKLYSNRTESKFIAKRPIILNGIDDIAVRGDLLNRSIILTLPSISKGERKDEAEIMENFYRDVPYILGSLYNALSAGLSAPKPELEERPRMTDFAYWVTRCEAGLPWEQGEILGAFFDNENTAMEDSIDGDHFITAVRNMLATQTKYEGTATQVVRRLRGLALDSSQKWMPTTRSLKKTLNRKAPALRAVGISWEFKRTGNKRMYILERTEEWERTGSEDDNVNPENCPF